MFPLPPSLPPPIGALAMGLATPSPGQLGSMTPEQMQAWRWEKELDERNRPMTDEELDALFPQEGYKVRHPLGMSLIRTSYRTTNQDT